METTNPATTAAGESTRYVPLRVHASGALGDVLLAEDVELGRQVALKQIKPEFARDLVSQRRFLTEAEVTGRLEHPGIVPVYGLGVHADGRLYYAMRFINGESLEQAIERFHQTQWQGRAEQNLAQRQLLRRFIDVCNAIAYAHSRGVLHRDLKPANVMLGPYGETLVVDWGLAKSLGYHDAKSAGSSNEKTLVLRTTTDLSAALAEMLAMPDEDPLLVPSREDSGRTTEGMVLGTPAFMSPEQAAGKIDQISPLSDVYSLGAILYTLLAGRPPFGGKRLMETLHDVRSGDFPSPRVFVSHLDPALESICLKAMELQADRRYPTGRDLAGDVERWLGDEPVSAYRESALVAARRWARQHQTKMMQAAAGLLLVVVGLLIGLGVLLSANRRLAADKSRLERANMELRQQNEAFERAAAQMPQDRKSNQ